MQCVVGGDLYLVCEPELARQRAAEEAAERVEVDAAKASLLAEERKNARLKKSFQAEQERLAREIIVARKHKEEQKLLALQQRHRERQAQFRKSGAPYDVGELRTQAAILLVGHLEHLDDLVKLRARRRTFRVASRSPLAFALLSFSLGFFLRGE